MNVRKVSPGQGLNFVQMSPDLLFPNGTKKPIARGKNNFSTGLPKVEPSLPTDGKTSLFKN